MEHLFKPALLLSLLLLLSGGCVGIPMLREANVASYTPANVFVAEHTMPPQIKRIAVMPVTGLTGESDMDFACETLGPVLLNELGRSRQFELVPVTAEELRVLTGRRAWTGEEQFPLDFFERLKERLGVDAVLFARLTQYRAYEPLSIGWRLKLLETEEPHVLWAVDEVFDARVPEVAAAARRFAKQQAASGKETWEVLNSPRQFGQYTASALVATLPPRPPGAAE